MIDKSAKKPPERYAKTRTGKVWHIVWSGYSPRAVETLCGLRRSMVLGELFDSAEGMPLCERCALISVEDR